jgi:hypothetical protein
MVYQTTPEGSFDSIDAKVGLPPSYPTEAIHKKPVSRGGGFCARRLL